MISNFPADNYDDENQNDDSEFQPDYYTPQKRQTNKKEKDDKEKSLIFIPNNDPNNEEEDEEDESYSSDSSTSALKADKPEVEILLEMLKDKEKGTFMRIFFIFAIIFALGDVILTFLSVIICIFFTLYPIIFEWVSICIKPDIINVVFTVLASLSDFGLFYLFFSYAYNLVENFVPSIWYSTLKGMEVSATCFYCRRNEEKGIFGERNKSNVMFQNNGIFLMIKTGIIILGFFYWNFLVLLSLLYTIYYILTMGMMYHRLLLYSHTSLYGRYVNEINKFHNPRNVVLSKTALSHYMLSRKNCPIVYKVIIGIIVTVSQFYIMAYSSLHSAEKSYYGQFGLLIGILMRIFLLPLVIDNNIYDTIFYPVKKWEEIKESKFRAVSIMVLVTYAVSIIIVVAIFVYSKFYPFPYVDNIIYIDRSHEFWYKDSNNRIGYQKPAFCNIRANNVIKPTTTDYAMMTTLPRYYGVTNDGKCYIKPKFRGVFNSTMKYIFGTDYHSRDINIYCYTQARNTYLVITAKEWLVDIVNQYDEGDVTLKSNAMTYATSKEYFTDPLCSDGIAKEQCHELEKCLDGGETDCMEEWSQYTNAYWMSFSDEFVPGMTGLEQYQLQIDNDTYISARAFDRNMNELTGTHIVVGGGVETSTEYFAFAEFFIRANIPTIISNIVPFYDYVVSYFEDMFTFIMEFTLSLMYVETLSSEETRALGDLMTHFDFPPQFVFMVGHSTTASTMKDLSFSKNFSGIAFEASISTGESKYLYSGSKGLFTQEDNLNNLANIYSDGTFFSGYDSTYTMNGALPSHFFNPNVYDTACLTYATCSDSMQYYEFCSQVLNQRGKDPIKKFHEIIDAYHGEGDSFPRDLFMIKY